MKKERAFLRRLAEFTDWLLTLVLAGVIAILSLLDQVSADLAQAVVLAVLALMSFNILRERLTRNQLDVEITRLASKLDTLTLGQDLIGDSVRTGVSRILDSAVDLDWRPLIDSASNDVTMVKIKGGFTNSPEFLAAFEGVLERGGHVTIAISDPRSPSMKLRYLQEPTALSSAKPIQRSSTHLWINGLDEIAGDIHKLHLWHRDLTRRGRARNLNLLLFPGYPTHAFFRFDTRLFVYHYPYMSRGFHAPCLVLARQEAPVHEYLLQCMDAMLAACTPMVDVADDIWTAHKRGDFSDSEMERVEVVVRRRPATNQRSATRPSKPR